MSVMKFIGVAALGITSLCGAASAATVDVFYKFGSRYDVNCTANCDGAEFGEFEVRMSYDNVELREPVGSFPDLDGIVFSYSGPTTANFVTPNGDLSFAATGGGNTEFLIYPGGSALVSPSEALSAPDGANFLSVNGLTGFFGRDVISSGQGGLYSYEFADNIFEGTDINTRFRLVTASGDVITGIQLLDDVSSTVYAVSYQLSGNGIPVPSPVPLPAAGLLLMGALGALGFSARKTAKST